MLYRWRINLFFGIASAANTPRLQSMGWLTCSIVSLKNHCPLSRVNESQEQDQVLDLPILELAAIAIIAGLSRVPVDHTSCWAAHRGLVRHTLMWVIVPVPVLHYYMWISGLAHTSAGTHGELVLAHITTGRTAQQRCGCLGPNTFKPLCGGQWRVRMLPGWVGNST